MRGLLHVRQSVRARARKNGGWAGRAVHLLVQALRLVLDVLRQPRFTKWALDHRDFVASALCERDLLATVLGAPAFVKAALKQRELVGAALKQRELVAAALQQPEFVEASLADRGFLSLVMEHRAHMATQLSIKQTADTRIAAFREEFDKFGALFRPDVDRPGLDWADTHPCLEDRTVTTPFDRHYLYHPAWAARVLARTRPAKHVDISSTVAFCSLVSAFVPVDFYDFRPAGIRLDGLYCGTADLNLLPFPDASIESLSCMHVIEHIGLGRYGDSLDPDGDLKSIRELVRVLAPGGNLLVATPVGHPRIQFNAHRIYDAMAFRDYFEGLELVEMALIEETSGNGLIAAPSPQLMREQRYGCGCFWLRKPVSSLGAPSSS